MTDPTKKTVDELLGDLFGCHLQFGQSNAVHELARRAQANDLVQAERDEFDEELHTCRAIVRATSEHLHVDLEEMVDKLRRTEADAHSWQELATARAQANDALRLAAQEAVYQGLTERDNGVIELTPGEPLRARLLVLRNALAAAPAPSSSGAPAPECGRRHANNELRCVKPVGHEGDHAIANVTWAESSARRETVVVAPAPADSQREARLGKDAIAALHWLANENGMAVVFEREIEGGEDPDPCRTMAEAVMDRCRERVKEARSAPPAPVAPVTDAEVEAAIRAYRSECIAPPEDDACEDEAFGYLRSLIARRVAEARGHGLRELRARLLSTAGSLPNRQMGHSDEDFDRGYVEACENWAQEIDRLLAAPPAGNGGA